MRNYVRNMFIRAVITGLIISIPLQGVSASTLSIAKISSDVSCLGPSLISNDMLSERHISSVIASTFRYGIRDFLTKHAHVASSQTNFIQEISGAQESFNVVAEGYMVKFYVAELDPLFDDENYMVFRVRCEFQKSGSRFADYFSLEFTLDKQGEAPLEVLEIYSANIHKTKKWFVEENQVKARSNPLKISLVLPSCKSFSFRASKETSKDYYLPMGLGMASIASTLRKWSVVNDVELEIQVIDAYTLGYGREEVLRELAIFKPDIVGFSVLTQMVKEAEEISKGIKRISPSTFVTWGGVHTTMAYDEVAAMPFVDLAVFGEGESKMILLAEIFNKNKTNTSQNSIDVLEQRAVFRKRAREELKNLPEPAYDMFPLDRYLWRGYVTASLESSRGCPGKCGFCAVPLQYGKRIEIKTPEQFVDGVERLHRKYGFEHFFVTDDNFVYTKKWVSKVADLLEERKIKVFFETYSRANVIANNPSMVKDLKRMGVNTVFIGVESGNKQTLESVSKYIDYKDVDDAVRLLDEEDIVVIAAFMVGFPNEDEQAIRDSISYAEHLKNIAPVVLHLARVAPYPGTTVYEEAVRNGLIEVAGYESFDSQGVQVMKTKHLSAEDVERLEQEFLMTFYTEEYITRLQSRENHWIVAREFVDSAKSIEEKAEASKEIGQIINISKQATRDITTNIEEKPRLIVPFEFYGNNHKEYEEDCTSFGDRFLLEYISCSDIQTYVERAITLSAKSQNKSVALIPQDTPRELLERLIKNNIKFIRVNREEFLLSREEENRNFQSTKSDIYAIMALFSAVKKNGENNEHFSRTMLFFISTHFSLGEVSPETVLKAIGDNNVDVLSAISLLLRPIEMYDMPKYHHIAPVILSA